jgi:hypothetical protein
MEGEIQQYDRQMARWFTLRTFQCPVDTMVDAMREEKEKYPETRYRLVLIVMEVR